jgi:hypothetical protein
MKAILIPANSSDPVKEIDFDPDKSWRYVVTRYDPGTPLLATDVAFLTKESAQRDYLIRNWRASEFVRNEFQAVNDQTDGLDPPEDLYGDVIVLGYDKAAFEKLTDVPAHIDLDDFEALRLGPANSSILVGCTDLDDFDERDSVRSPDRDRRPLSNPWKLPKTYDPANLNPPNPSTTREISPKPNHPNLNPPRPGGRGHLGPA